jgi:hypothetical protein
MKGKISGAVLEEVVDKVRAILEGIKRPRICPS